MRSGKRRNYKSDVLQKARMKSIEIGIRSSGSGFDESRGSFNSSGFKFPEQGNRIGMSIQVSLPLLSFPA